MHTENNRVVCYGEVLWDILPKGSKLGGAPMNVAYHLKTLGESPVLVTRVGLDAHGKDLLGLMANYGIGTDFFQIDGTQPTGKVYARFNDEQEMSYDIVFPSAWDFIHWEETLTPLVQKAEYFVYGSLTSRSATSRDTLYRLLEAATTKVLDINLRPPHFNRAGLQYLLQHSDVLKMNSSELDLLSDWFGKGYSGADRISYLQESFDIQTIIVTLGAEGALLLDKGRFSQCGGFKVQVQDTIGSGDAFLAGFLHQMQTGASAQQALVFASALGALIASYAGGCPRYQRSEITALIHSDSTTNIHAIS
jgi:fructokinase